MAKNGKKPATRAASARGLSARLPRRRKATRLQKRKHDKKTVGSYKPVPGGFRLVASSFEIFKRYWKPLGGIVFVYLVLNIIFASGISNVSGVFDEIKFNLQMQGARHFLDALGGFGALIGSAGSSSSETGAVLQALLFVIESLVIIWALRQLLSDKIIGVKEAYYSSTAPLIPFLLVIFVIVLQLLPITVGSLIVSAIVTAIVGPGTTATLITIFFVALLTAWSIYMISASIFALYIVTLPDMKPRDALRSAKRLVKFRRWRVIRRVIFLPVFVFVTMGLIIIPMILYADFMVTWVFYGLSMLAVLFIHTYLYSLYRGLLE